MAQRGGSVSSHIRIESQDVSPVIPLRHADVLIGFELAEAARQLNRLKPDASAVVNVDCIIPTNVALRQGEYHCDEYLSAIKNNIGQGVLHQRCPMAIEAGMRGHSTSSCLAFRSELGYCLLKKMRSGKQWSAA
jgi:Pyruvate:ferredoxin oxidoreductase and related 2-oxoacid:ferredoxin oxidoreductases, gamma subunit